MRKKSKKKTRMSIKDAVFMAESQWLPDFYEEEVRKRLVAMKAFQYHTGVSRNNVDEIPPGRSAKSILAVLLKECETN